jgi:hypothetical protein
MHSKDEPTARPYETNLPAIRPHHSTFGPGGCHFPAISDNHRCRGDPHQQSICTQNLRSKHGKFTSTCGRCSFSTFTCTDHTRRGTRPSVNPSKSDLVDAKQLQCATSTTNTPSLPQSDYIRGRAIPSPGVEGKEKLPVKSTCSGGGMSFAVFITAPACQRCLDPLHRGGFIAGMARRSRTFKKGKKEGMNNAKHKTYNGVTSRGTEPIALEQQSEHAKQTALRFTNRAKQRAHDRAG